MLNLEHISKNITKKLKKELSLDDEKASIIQYGLYAFFHMGLSILLIAIVGAFFNVMIEAVLISFIISILRKSSGGAHASTSLNCAIIGVIISVVPAFIIKKIPSQVNFIMVIGILVCTISMILILKLAPIDSPNKPIRKKEKIERLKKESVITLTIYIILLVLNILIYYYNKDESFLIYCSCIYIGILWQVFTLTKLGHMVTRIIDSLLIKFLNRERDI